MKSNKFHINFSEKSLGILVIIIAPFVLLSPVIFTGKALFWGTVSLQFIPWRNLAAEILRMGELPLWNPYSGMGSPLLANYQSAIFYPPNWFVLILNFVGGVGWLAWGHGVLVAAHLSWAGMGMALLIKRIRLSLFAQIIGGLAYSLSGYLVARAGFFSINSVTAWFPWLLLLSTSSFGIEETEYSLKLSHILRIGAIFFLLMAGHAQIAWYILLFAFVWGLFTQIMTHHNGSLAHAIKEVLNYSFIYITTIIVAIGLSAIQLIPTLEFLLNSQRATAMDYNTITTYSFWPWRLITIILPDFFGNPGKNIYWGYGNYWEDALYFGTFPLIAFLSFLGVRNYSSMSIRYYQKIKIFILFTIFVSFVLALGKNLPVYQFFYKYIPTFNMFQAPTRITIWAQLCLCLGAALGVDRWKAPSGRLLYWIRLFIAASIALILSSIIGRFLVGSVDISFFSALLNAGILFCITGYLILFSRYKEDSHERQSGDDLLAYSPVHKKWRFVAIIFVAVDLIIAGWGLNPGISQEFYNQLVKVGEDHEVSDNAQRLFTGLEDEYELKYFIYMRFDSYEAISDWSDIRETFLPNLNILSHMMSANNYDPLLLDRYPQWIELLDNELKQDKSIHQRYLMNLSGIRLVGVKDASIDSGLRFEAVENSSRFQWAPCAKFYKNENRMLSDLNDGSGLTTRFVFVEGDVLTQPEYCTNENVDFESMDVVIEKISETANKIVLRVSSNYDGWFVVADSWYPGWKARVNDLPVKILRGNYMFRTIPLEAGTSEIVFYYQPVSFVYGGLLSFVSALIVGIYWCKFKNK